MKVNKNKLINAVSQIILMNGNLKLIYDPYHTHAIILML